MEGCNRPPRDAAQVRGRHINITALVREEAGVVLRPTTSSGVHCIFFVMGGAAGRQERWEMGGNNLCALRTVSLPLQAGCMDIADGELLYCLIGHTMLPV